MRRLACAAVLCIALCLFILGIAKSEGKVATSCDTCEVFSYRVITRNGLSIEVLKVKNPNDFDVLVEWVKIDKTYETNSIIRSKDSIIFMKIGDFFIAPLSSSVTLLPIESTYYKENKFLDISMICENEETCDILVFSPLPPTRVASSRSIKWSYANGATHVHFYSSSRINLTLDFSFYDVRKARNGVMLIEDKRKVEELEFQIENLEKRKVELKREISELEKREGELEKRAEELEQVLSQLKEEKNNVSIEVESMRLLAMSKSEKLSRIKGKITGAALVLPRAAFFAFPAFVLVSFAYIILSLVRKWRE